MHGLMGRRNNLCRAQYLQPVWHLQITFHVIWVVHTSMFGPHDDQFWGFVTDCLLKGYEFDVRMPILSTYGQSVTLVTGFVASPKHSAHSSCIVPDDGTDTLSGSCR